MVLGVLFVIVCAEAVFVPAKRPVLLDSVGYLVGSGLIAHELRRQRRDGAARAARRAAMARDDIPADVIDLVAADKKIRAIKRYRELTGANLREAKAVIDGL